MKMCLLIDWADEDGNVAEGCILSSEPDDIVNDTRLGPTDFIVLVESANEPEVYLWRPARNMCTIKEVVGHIIAWPKNKCVELGQGLQPKDIAPLVNFFSLLSYKLSLQLRILICSYYSMTVTGLKSKFSQQMPTTGFIR